MSKFSKEANLIEQSGLFDRNWYLDQYPDVKALSADPIQHYLRIGVRLQRDPSPHFRTAYYLDCNPDVAETGLNPLLHYLEIGKIEGRLPLPPSTVGRAADDALAASASQPKSANKHAAPVSITPLPADIDPIASHEYAPRVGAINFSAISECRDLTHQYDWVGHFDGLKRTNTLGGWAFNKTAPTDDLELHLFIHGIHVSSTIANISRPDVGKAFGLTSAANVGFIFNLQNFEPAGALELLRRFGRTMPEIDIASDVRVCIAAERLCLRGKPAHVLDLNLHMPALVRAAAIQLRQELHNAPADRALSAIDMDILLRLNPLFHAEWYARKFFDVAETDLTPTQHFLTLDKDLERPASPWFDTAAYLDAAPDVRDASMPAILHYDVHGHDTWWPGQGKFRDDRPDAEGNGDHAVLIHLFHLDTAPDLQWMLRSFAPDVDIFITIPEDSPDHDPDVIAKLFPQAREILTVPNRGQDIGAFLHAVRHLKGRGYRFFCKAHSKKGNKYPDTWRRVMLDALASTSQRVDDIVRLFRSDFRVLIAGPEEFWFDGRAFLAGNEKDLSDILGKLEFGHGAVHSNWGFFAGTCFWIDASLAEVIASVVSADDFKKLVVQPDGQLSHALERIFGLVTQIIGGRVALVSGCNWHTEPKIAIGNECILPDKDLEVRTWISRHLKSLSSPAIIPGTSTVSETTTDTKQEIFQDVDTALHGSIDVMVSCWNSNPENLHTGLAHLGHALEAQGLTCAFLVGNKTISHVFHSASCRNVVVDSSLLFGAEAQDIDVALEDAELPRDTALSWLRSEALFTKKPLPKNGELDSALANIERLYAHWRAVLIRRKVKLFLIWGTTAPKSRMFLHLCQELGIEYQILERGHFPGTLSVDPMGQFGASVMPRLVQHVAHPETTDLDARFEAIRSWYQAQSDKSAYAKFQRRDTREIATMKRARSFGRPIILVIGANDQGAGVVGPDPDPLRVNWFGSSDQAFTLIRRLVLQKFPDALLVLRPHPSQAPQEADFVLVARDSALEDLVDQADLCISVATSASAFCLIKDKPLLTLGLSELNGSGVGIAITDETHLLSAMRHAFWSDFKTPYPDAQNRRFIVDLFDKHLVGVDASVPTRHHIAHLAQLIAGRIQRMKTGFLQDFAGREEEISRAMFEDVRDRGRAIFPVDPRAFVGRTRPAISIVLPIYGDYEGTRICFEQLMRHQAENGYRVITVWDRGPDERLRDLCLEYAEKAGFTYLENRENVGFSGTVNQGILEAGRDDVILLNSDTVQCGDWALRLQDAAYAHPKIAAVVPFSNSATIYNIPFPNGINLPEAEQAEWVLQQDRHVQHRASKAIEMPISHGFCTFVKRSTFDRLGFFNEMMFDKGHGEDNEFSMRIRAAGLFCACATNVFVGHAGSTSFAEDAMKWKLAGREAMRNEFSHYFEEISAFFRNDPLSNYRGQIV